MANIRQFTFESGAMGINNATVDGKWCLGWNVKVFTGIIDVNFDEMSI
jgi:hypothetical protein